MDITASNKSYFIVHGFAEGKFHSRKLESDLKDLGWIPAKDTDQATIVIGHSGGCLLISSPNAVFINPTVWPGKSYASKFSHKVRHSFSPANQLFNILYIFMHPLHNVGLLGPYLRANKSHFHSSAKITIIRNNNDSWCSPEIGWYYPHATIHHLPGTHDDCWDNPKAYIEVIKAAWIEATGTSS